VWIEGERIVALTDPSQRAALGQADRTIDATGQYVLPGGIDAHTHMDLPFGGTTASDDFETGTIAAAHGGTTTIIDFAIQQKGGTLRAGLDTWHAKAEGKAAIDYGFHMIMTEANAETLEEMAALVARASPASRCSWPTRACSWSTTSRSSGRCCGPASWAR
jgi:dihydropyrimidinase